MMKKVDKKKIILSVLLSSMLWSNSLYAMELTGEIKEEYLINNNDKFKVITIKPDDNDDNVYTTKNIQDQITITDAKVYAHISNIKAVENSEVFSVYGGYGYNTNNNVIEISSKSRIYIDVAGGAYGESNNYNTLTIENSNMGINVFGGGYGSDNNFNKITLINTTANNNGGVVAGGYYIHDSSVGKTTDKVNVIENEVNVIRRDIENEVIVIDADINYLYGGYVSNVNKVVTNINVEGNNVKIDNLGKSRDDREEVNNIIGGAVDGTVNSSKKDIPDEVK